MRFPWAMILGVGVAFAQEPAGTCQPWIGRRAPEFTLKDLQGKPTALRAFRGRVVVLHITATWCPYCAAEIQGLLAIDQDYQSKGVQVLMVDVKEPESTVARVAAQHGVGFPVLLDKSGAVARRYCPAGVRPELARDEVALASNLILDRQGRIRHFSLFSTGAYDPRLGELRKALDAVLEAP